MGAYIRHNKINIKQFNMFILMASFIATNGLFNIYKFHNSPFDFATWNFWENLFTAIATFFIFAWIFNIRYRFDDENSITKVFVFISKYSYAAYLVSPVIERLVYSRLNSGVGNYLLRLNYYPLAILLISSCSLIISLFITKTYEFVKQRFNSGGVYLLIILLIIFIPYFSTQIPTLERKVVGWYKYSSNQILGDETTGSLFDPSVIKDDGEYKLYVSKRNEGSIVLYTSKDGIEWDKDYQSIIKTDNIKEYSYNRGSVVKVNGVYYLYYTRQYDSSSKPSGNYDVSEILVGTSTDGVNFDFSYKPIIVHQHKFEGKSVMNPDVVYDYDNNLFKMYYAAGEIYEPDCICLATSKDGIKWEKDNNNPILTKSSNQDDMDSYKVGATNVHIINGMYYMFYIGYTDINTARILMMKSKDGINFDESSKIVITQPDSSGFDKDATYKPAVVFDDINNRYMLYYNGRTNSSEYIGLYLHNGNDL
jgi:predicted GH43/DUF377 family glycosyl hydrolase